MPSNLDVYRDELKELIAVGERMATDLALRALRRNQTIAAGADKVLKEAHDELEGVFEKEYQVWYTQAYAVILQLLPERAAEFRALYQPDPKRKSIDVCAFAIQDWLLGIRAGFPKFDDLAVVVGKLSMQRHILKAAQLRFESRLFDLRNLVRADVFDSELEASRELIKVGFLRAAGVIAGVVLEGHLRQVCDNHSIRVTKRRPTIGDLNDILKNSSVYDVTVWRNLQRLGDLRNLCGHNRGREPTKGDVLELVEGVEKVSKTVL